MLDIFSTYNIFSLQDFWNIFDVVVIAMGIIVVIFNLYRVMEVGRLLEGLLKEDSQYANFETLGHWQELFNDFIAVAVFFAWIKVSFLPFSLKIPENPKNV